MKLIKPSVEILTPVDTVEVYKTIEKVARTCYKSEDKITDTSAERMVKSLIKSGHEAMIEFFDITVKFVTDRGVSHEIVRHRLGSFAQESTRYCNYSNEKFGKELVFIEPYWLNKYDNKLITESFLSDLRYTETRYLEFIRLGLSPQEARQILPQSIKTEINVKFNLREWRHFLNLRCHHTAHPDIRLLSLDLLSKLYSLLPVVFEDLYIKYNDEDKHNK
jgi:thymidylate synthase (FAD)